MRSQTIIAISAAIVAVAVVGFIIAYAAFNLGSHQNAAPAARSTPQPATTSASPTPRPTVTVTHPAPRHTVVVVPHSDDDQAFLNEIAADGIKAPDDWAITAGHKTCPMDYADAYTYLTDGGIYGYHVQTFLDDWADTHDGC